MTRNARLFIVVVLTTLTASVYSWGTGGNPVSPSAIGSVILLLVVLAVLYGVGYMIYRVFRKERKPQEAATWAFISVTLGIVVLAIVANTGLGWMRTIIEPLGNSRAWVPLIPIIMGVVIFRLAEGTPPEGKISYARTRKESAQTTGTFDDLRVKTISS